MHLFSIGNLVKTPYKSGIYIGEIIEDRSDKFLVKILAVEKHPIQGDLHHPKQVDGVLFHERKALAQYEKINVLKDIVTPYEEDAIPDYGESLKRAVTTYREQLQRKEGAYYTQALHALETVEKSYYIGRNY
ncbi:sporulation phosphorelay system protein KapB [Ornithinibacillus contaminans]|uniref:sporulation phosphorelay system protein KapB n=1 Tax=Ornithinibacillus contaminans TaxID=694055 RepID=UPI00064D985C|nr:sporulation phosphorelay system protein KapB [Ornithinibacillus contaminans]